MTALVEHLLAYPRFVVDFLAMRALAPYEQLHAVAEPLARHFGVGLTIAILLALVPRRGGYRATRDEAGGETRPSGAASQLGTFLLVFAGGALVLHGLLVLYAAWIAPIPLGTLQDTANAALAYAAVYLPIHAAAIRLRQEGDALVRRYERAHRTVKNVKLGIGLAQLGFLFYVLYAVGAVYGMPLRATVRPVLASVVGTVVVLTAVSGIFLIAFQRRGKDSFTT